MTAESVYSTEVRLHRRLWPLTAPTQKKKHFLFFLFVFFFLRCEKQISERSAAQRGEKLLK